MTVFGPPDVNDVTAIVVIKHLIELYTVQPHQATTQREKKVIYWITASLENKSRRSLWLPLFS